MFSPKTSRDITRTIPFGILWFVFSLIYTILEKSILGDLDHYPLTGVKYEFSRNLFIIPAAALIMGIMTGILEVSYFSKKFIKSSFTRKIVFKSIVYLLILISFSDHPFVYQYVIYA